MESTTLEQGLAVLWRRRWTVLGVFVATLAAVAAVTYSLPKVYTSRAFVLVQPAQQAQGDFAAVELTQTLAKTYAELLQSPNLAGRVQAALLLPISEEELLDAVEVEPVTDTQLLAVEASAESPTRARVLADTYATVFVDRADELGAGVASPAELSIAESAFTPGAPSQPKPRLYLLIGAILAAALAAAAALLRERFSQGLEVDASDVRLFDRAIIGRIPAWRSLSDADLDRLERDRIAEPFRLLFANLAFATSQRTHLSLAVASADRGEGKTFCAVNLARAATEFGHSVLLVDADLRLGTLSSQFGVDPFSPGLSDILAGLPDAEGLAAVTVQTDEPRLRLVPAHPIPNPGALLGSATLRTFDELARSAFDLVVYDSIPVSVGADASLVAAAAAGSLLVVDAQQARRRSVTQALNQLDRANANVLGIVLNRAPGVKRDHGYRPKGAGATKPGTDVRDGDGQSQARGRRRRLPSRG